MSARPITSFFARAGAPKTTESAGVLRLREESRRRLQEEGRAFQRRDSDCARVDEGCFFKKYVRASAEEGASGADSSEPQNAPPARCGPALGAPAASSYTALAQRLARPPLRASTASGDEASSAALDWLPQPSAALALDCLEADAPLLPLWTLFASSLQPRGAPLTERTAESLAPPSCEQVCGNERAVLGLGEWLRAHSDRRRLPKRKRRRGEDEDEEPAVLALVRGASGAGKTCAVYAAARQLGIRVIEIEAGQLRSAAAVRRLVSEATQSRGVLNDEQSRAALSLVLFDEADLVFEEDCGLLQAVAELARSSKAPIVLTAQRPVPLPRTVQPVFVDLARPAPAQAALGLQEALRRAEAPEGLSLRLLAEAGAGDMRACLAALALAPSHPLAADPSRFCAWLRERRLDLGYLDALAAPPSEPSPRPPPPRPEVFAVLPASLDRAGPALLALTGRGFAGATPLLLAGAERCVVRVASDSLLFALVSAPCVGVLPLALSVDGVCALDDVWVSVKPRADGEGGGRLVEEAEESDDFETDEEECTALADKERRRNPLVVPDDDDDDGPEVRVPPLAEASAGGALGLGCGLGGGRWAEEALGCVRGLLRDGTLAAALGALLLSAREFADDQPALVAAVRAAYLSPDPLDADAVLEAHAFQTLFERRFSCTPAPSLLDRIPPPARRAPCAPRNERAAEAQEALDAHARTLQLWSDADCVQRGAVLCDGGLPLSALGSGELAVGSLATLRDVGAELRHCSGAVQLSAAASDAPAPLRIRAASADASDAWAVDSDESGAEDDTDRSPVDDAETEREASSVFRGYLGCAQRRSELDGWFAAHLRDTLEPMRNPRRPRRIERREFMLETAPWLSRMLASEACALSARGLTRRASLKRHRFAYVKERLPLSDSALGRLRDLVRLV